MEKTTSPEKEISSIKKTFEIFHTLILILFIPVMFAFFIPMLFFSLIKEERPYSNSAKPKTKKIWVKNINEPLLNEKKKIFKYSD